jgi:hypothetical protein
VGSYLPSCSSRRFVLVTTGVLVLLIVVVAVVQLGVLVLLVVAVHR